MSHIIAIAAPIGGGKTSLVTAIAKRLGDAGLLFHDHYETATGEPVENLVQWLEDGADFNAFSLPGLAEDLERLKQGKAVVDPSSDQEIRPGKYTVFEMPLGRAHSASAKFIDLLLWIDVPLDIALARKIGEFTGDILKGEKPEALRDRLLWIDQYLEGYLAVVRDVLTVQGNKVGKDADVVIDGQQALADMTEEAVKEIVKRFP